MSVKKALMVIVLTWIGIVTPAAAQTSTPGITPVTPIYAYNTDVVFPSAVYFDLTLEGLAGEWAFAVLTIRPPQQPAVTLPVSIVEAAVLREPYTVLGVTWDIPRESPLALLSEVPYEWQVTRSDERVFTAQGTFVFTDTRITWRVDTAEDSRLTFTVPEEGFPLALSQLRRDMQMTYDLMRANTGAQPDFHIMLYPAELTPGCTINEEGDAVARGLSSGLEIPCDPSLAAALYRVSEVDAFQLPLVDSDARLRLALADLFLQRFYASLWENTTMPLWFQAGLAQFYLPTIRANLLEPSQRAARNNRLFTLDELNALPVRDPDLWRAQSYGLVLYIARQNGVPALFALARDPGESFTASYENATGQPLSALIASWERWLFTSPAEDAYIYNPHLATTATPTFTPSATPPRPTATPTNTYTPSATATATATPLPAGVLPTMTPTRTPTPAPATITPRPPGSLNTATPTAIPAAGFSAAGGSALGVGLIVVVFVVLAGLTVVYLRMGRKQ